MSSEIAEFNPAIDLLLINIKFKLSASGLLPGAFDSKTTVFESETVVFSQKTVVVGAKAIVFAKKTTLSTVLLLK